MSNSTTPGPGSGPNRKTPWDTTVAALTEATRAGADIGEFLATALAATAANVGSGYRVLAGRPGSWEADLVRGLIHGTIGHDEEYLAENRTEPVEITVHVAALICDRTGTYPVDDELEAIDKRYTAMSDDEYDAHAGEQEGEEAAVNLKWATRFADYGAHFKTAVEAKAAKIGIRVPVTVTIDPDVDWNAHAGIDYEASDALIGRLFEAGAAAVLVAHEQDVTP